MPLRPSTLPCVFAAVVAVISLPGCDREQESLPPPAAATKSTERDPVTPPPPEAPAPLKIATVDMMRILKESPRTIAAEKEHQTDLVQIQRENQTRLDRIRALDTELENLTKILTDPAVSDMKRQAALTERTAKREDAVAFDRERREFFQRRQQALRETAVGRTRALIEEIRLIVTDLAREEGFDYVFDTSAASLNQIPFVISSKSTKTDLSDAIIAQLNRDSSTAGKSSPGTAAGTPPGN